MEVLFTYIDSYGTKMYNNENTIVHFLDISYYVFKEVIYSIAESHGKVCAINESYGC
jgi:hypothetical protein